MIIVQLDGEQLSNLIESSVRKVLEETMPKMMAGQQEHLLTVYEAAELLKLTVPTVRKKVSTGELPVMSRNKRLYFSSVELLQYIRGGHKKSNAEIEQGENNN